MLALQTSPISIATLAVILTAIGGVALIVGLLFAVLGGRIHARFLHQISVGLVGHLRMFGILVALIGAVFFVAGLSNLGSTV